MRQVVHLPSDDRTILTYRMTICTAFKRLKGGQIWSPDSLLEVSGSAWLILFEHYPTESIQEPNQLKVKMSRIKSKKVMLLRLARLT